MFPVVAVDPELVPDVLIAFDCPDPVADPNIELIPGIPLETHEGTLFATVLVSMIVVGVVASVTLFVNKVDTAVLISGTSAAEVVVGYETVVALESELEPPDDSVSVVVTVLPELEPKLDVVSNPLIVLDDDPYVLPKLLPVLGMEVEFAPI